MHQIFLGGDRSLRRLHRSGDRFAIGLVNPTATSWLIHTFVMAWAVEWVVFLVEMSAITIYYYGWGRVSPKNHRKIGWLLAFLRG